MLIFTGEIFSDLMITGTTMYTSPVVINRLGAVEKLVFSFLCRQLGNEAHIKAQVETSSDGKHWVNANTSYELDEDITSGTITRKLITADVLQLGGFVRLRLEATGAFSHHLIIHAVGRGGVSIGNPNDFNRKRIGNPNDTVAIGNPNDYSPYRRVDLSKQLNRKPKPKFGPSGRCG
jgi:hypothetical protein